MVPLSMTLSDLEPTFQGHDIFQRQVAQKRYQIELYLQGGPIESRICLSNGAIFNDLEQAITQFSKSHYSLMLNIS